MPLQREAAPALTQHCQGRRPPARIVPDLGTGIPGFNADQRTDNLKAIQAWTVVNDYGAYNVGADRHTAQDPPREVPHPLVKGGGEDG